MSPKKTNDQTIAFISDWQKRSSKQQKTFILVLAVAMLISILIGVIGFFWFQDENYARIVNQNMNYIQDSAVQEAYHVEKDLTDSVKLISNLANQYSLLAAEYPETTIEKRLTLLNDASLFDRISFISADGTDTSLKGVCSVSDREYFQRAMAGESGYEFLESSRINQMPIMIFYAPVMDGQEITGIMAGFYEWERIDELLTYQFLNYTPTTYLLQGNGTVIGSSNDTYEKENLLEWLKTKSFTGEIGFPEIQAAIDSEAHTTVSFAFEAEGEVSGGVIAPFRESDLMLLSFLPSDITASMIKGANRSGQVLMISITIAFLILILLFLCFLLSQWKRMKTEMQIATESLTETFLHDQQQSFIIESLGNTYSSIYYVTLNDHTYERITEREHSVLNIPDAGNWEPSFRGYVRSFVDAAYQEALLTLFTPDNYEEQIGENLQISTEYQRVDKEWRRAIMLPAMRDKNDRISSVIFAVQQITDQKKKELETQKALQEAYEAAQLASRAKTTFLSNMSHDIRTPMNAIVGMTAIAAANLQNTEKVSDCLKKITGSSKHLLGLINEVLDMSKIESGKVDLNEEHFSLSDLIDELLCMNQPLIKEKQQTLLVKVKNLTHENVTGDHTRLQQVFTNLLTNAIKYTPEGGKIEILVSEKATNKPTIGWYEVIFRDNGIGMTEEFKKKIFEPFSRANDARISSIQGTGLGMPIARNIIRMMNGDITVDSRPNEGSTFTVSFALKLQQKEEIDYTDFIDLPVLVVDDDLISCESICTILTDLSIQCEYVTSGRQAVEKTVERHERQEDYYAVILDWKMPDMNGVETAREIRRQVGNDLPIIVISAYDWTDIEEEARAAGVNAFLGKPLFRSKIISLFSGFMQKEPAEPTAAAVTAETLSAHSFRGKRILLAEDNELNCEIAVEILSMMELAIDTAENGKLCLEKFKASKRGYYDLIFMDIQMPVMNGYEAAAAIRSSGHPDAGSIPIIAMTANAFSTDVRAAFDSGMNGHISKPIDISMVVNTLTEYLGGK